MTVTFVTALYLPIDSSAAEKYMKLGVWLVTAQVPLWIYTAPCLATRMRQEWSDISHVTIIDNVDMEAYWTQEVLLPEERNVQKDTPFYVSVQLTKLRVCARTSQTVDTRSAG